uniref:CBS domain-containing protein n=2 Tax=Lotharella oceanica TaxID=641309 RepID=A0A7S2U1L1_9EUKA|mmetsp:Transcript_6101/g.12224  ORF Transcript_6101/g.12224 Transcript_6101/m.12224 type:complete len:311 (+) Transcript_6101:177-1109(+)
MIDDREKFIAIVSISDIVRAIVMDKSFDKFASGRVRPQEKDIRALLKQSTVFRRTISTMVGNTEESKTFRVFDEKTSFSHLFRHFSQGFHRALVMRREGEGGCLISQSDCVRFIYKKMMEESGKEEVENLARKPLSELGVLYNVHALSIKDTETALAGFRKMLRWRAFSKWNLGAIPVVDKKGRVVANLSESDLRGADRASFVDLLKPVVEYLRTTHGSVRTPVAATGATTFSEAIRTILDEKIHRLWIVNKDGDPIGVVSLSDIISKFTNFNWAHTRAYELALDFQQEPEPEPHYVQQQEERKKRCTIM